MARRPVPLLQVATKSGTNQVHGTAIRHRAERFDDGD
jgi:hypothetical protein